MVLLPNPWIPIKCNFEQGKQTQLLESPFHHIGSMSLRILVKKSVPPPSRVGFTNMMSHLYFLKGFYASCNQFQRFCEQLSTPQINCFSGMTKFQRPAKEVYLGVLLGEWGYILGSREPIERSCGSFATTWNIRVQELLKRRYAWTQQQIPTF